MSEFHSELPEEIRAEAAAFNVEQESGSALEKLREFMDQNNNSEMFRGNDLEDFSTMSAEDLRDYIDEEREENESHKKMLKFDQGRLDTHSPGFDNAKRVFDLQDEFIARLEAVLQTKS